MTRAAPAAALAAVLVASVWGLLHVGWYESDQITDYGVYQQYGDFVAKDHAVPYRDFRLEYPPAALPLFIAPSLLGRFGYRTMFQLEIALCLFGAVVGALLIAGPRAARSEERRVGKEWR